MKTNDDTLGNDGVLRKMTFLTSPPAGSALKATHSVVVHFYHRYYLALPMDIFFRDKIRMILSLLGVEFDLKFEKFNVFLGIL